MMGIRRDSRGTAGPGQTLVDVSGAGGAGRSAAFLRLVIELATGPGVEAVQAMTPPGSFAGYGAIAVISPLDHPMERSRGARQRTR